MSSRTPVGLLATAVILLTVGGCSRDLDPLGLAPFPSEALVFGDGFADGVGFQAFGGSKTDAVQIDQVERFQGDASLRITIPLPSDPSGSYAGGAFTANVPRNLTGYNALTFWAKASIPASLDVAGLGNDNTGTSLHTAQTGGLALSSTWTRYVIPIPLPSKLDQEAGLFFFAEGAEAGQAYTLWFDEIKFETVSNLGSPSPSVVTRTVALEVGDTAHVAGSVTFSVGDDDVVVSAAPAYFTYTTSDAAVATVSGQGVITKVGEGSATITAALGSVQASGSVTVNTPEEQPTEPATAAPTPTQGAANVVSLFSDAYTDVPVDTWNTVWSAATLEEVQIEGNAAKKYSGLDFNGAEFTAPTVDASAMTHFRMDVWTPNATSFGIKLVDLGADGAFGGGDDTEHQVDFDSGTTPALTTGQWISLDIPMADFTNLANRANLAQLIIVGQPTGSATVFVDNVYFYDANPVVPTEPTTAAPTPDQDAANVVSLFSDAYTDVPVDTWNTVWSAATLEEVQIEGNATKKYSGLDFNGAEFTAPTVDASAMTHFRMDVWTPDATDFGIKFVDFGADDTFGGGDDTEQQLDFDSGTTPALATGQWVSLDIPMEDFTNLTNRSNLGQLIIVAQPTGSATVFVDNVYFYDANAAAPTEPATAAPTPGQDAANVISLFSDAYTDVTVDTWSAGWDQADEEIVQIEGNATRKYTSLVFAGIEFTSSPVDAGAMTHFHVDVWTPDPTDSPASLLIKLVDFGADGAFGGGDDVEHEITLNDASTPPLATGSWVSYDIPLTEFANLTTRGALAQLILSSDPNTVFVDNVYFHN